MSTNPDGITRRRRASSLLAYIDDDAHHLSHLSVYEPLITEPAEVVQPPYAPQSLRPRKKRPTTPPLPTNVLAPRYGPRWLAWLTAPEDSLVVLLGVFALWAAWRTFLPAYRDLNPASPFLFVSHPVKWGEDGKETRFKKGPLDVLFLVYWIIVFAFIRSALHQGPLKKLARQLGIKKKKKLERFLEQGYAIFYFGLSSIIGLYVMRQQDTWWYNLDHLWLNYDTHWAMTRAVKTYYLVQFAYWLSESLVMIAGLEAPRQDFVELVLHHIITAWLVGASYYVNLTQIGIAIFVSMDIPDVLLAISKCINYVGLEKTGNCSFLVFMAGWGYLRHYQNIRILHSVWTQQHLVPESARTWDPPRAYLAPWMRYQIFLPILLLQILIAFWSYLILRIVFRMLSGTSASDTREEGETDTDATPAEGGLGASPLLSAGGLSPALPLKDLRTRSRSGTMTSINEGTGSEGENGSAAKDGKEMEQSASQGVRTRSQARKA